MVDTLMARYDQDGSGRLDRKELKPLLRDYSTLIHHEDNLPSENDLNFLVAVANGKGGSCNGEVNKGNLALVIATWDEYLMQKNKITQLLAEYDTDGSRDVEVKELQELLEGLNEGLAVPQEAMGSCAKWSWRERFVPSTDGDARTQFSPGHNPGEH